MTKKATGGSKPCPVCKENNSATVDSRPTQIDGAIWRRTCVCGACKTRFSTLEYVVAVNGERIEQTRDMAVIEFVKIITTAAKDLFGDRRHMDAGQLGRKRND